MMVGTTVGLGSEGVDPVAGFVQFGVTHGLVSVLFVCILFGLMLAARGALRSGGSDGLAFRRFERVLGWGCVGVWLVMNAWYLSPQEFAWDESLPLHVCDVVAIAGPIAVLTRSRFLMALTWFWGVGLSSQGLLTPVLEVGSDSMRFYLFWANHWIAVGLGIVFIAVYGLRPSFQDLVRMLAFGLAWVGGLFVLGWLAGGNYGYVGRATPENPTVLDALGDWPWRALWVTAIGVVLMALLWLPFAIGRRLGMNWAYERDAIVAGGPARGYAL